MFAIKALTPALALLSTRVLAFPKLQPHQFMEMNFYDDCDGLVQTSNQASHPGTVQDVGIYVNETFNGVVVESSASVTCSVFSLGQPGCTAAPIGEAYYDYGTPGTCATLAGSESWAVYCSAGGRNRGWVQNMEKDVVARMGGR